MGQRLQALLDHYAALRHLIDEQALTRAYSDKLTLVQIDTGLDHGLAIQLFYRDQFEKEGEITVAIEHRATKLMLAGITFSLGSSPDGRHVVIGGLQASPGPATRELINETTKHFHGMRPKALAFWCLQQLCAAWSVTQISAISDAQHIYRHAHKRRDFSASYDEFWEESDGTRRPDGFWELPLQLRHRQREELKASRRKAHERRYAALSKLQPLFLDAAWAIAPRSAHLNRQLAAAPQFQLEKNEARTPPTVTTARQDEEMLVVTNELQSARSVP